MGTQNLFRLFFDEHLESSMRLRRPSRRIPGLGGLVVDAEVQLQNRRRLYAEPDRRQAGNAEDDGWNAGIVRLAPVAFEDVLGSDVSLISRHRCQRRTRRT